MSGSAYQVGRNRPPVSTRFKKGQSATPVAVRSSSLRFGVSFWPSSRSSRPAPTANPSASRQALIRKLLELALGGNLRAMNVIFAYLQRVPEPDDADEELGESDLQILKHLEERERQGVDQPNGGKEPPE